MSLILGMDIFVFIAWLGTILAAIFCVLYGIYYEFIKKSNSDNENNKSLKTNKKSREEA
jgi:predicted outer membrane lipoprotein